MNMEHRIGGLTGNQLKILAMVFMTCDHVGLQLLPGWGFLRILGRLALPIYAYMIAEGCTYTHDRKKYLLRLLGLGALCQAVYFIAMGSLYMGILITFSLAAGLIFLADRDRKSGRPGSLWLGLGMAVAFFLCVVLPTLLPGTDYGIDYGFMGVLLPVLIWCGKDRKQKLLLTAVGLVLLALDLGGIQWWALSAVPLLALYNGQRGKYHIGKLFYLYYPLHLVVIYGLSLIFGTL